MGGAAGGYQEEQDYGATPPGMSAGLVTTSTGETHFVLLATPTFGQAVGGVYPGAANSLANVSPIVMTELQYDPSDPTAAETTAGYIDGDDFEYIELYNRSGSTQTLSSYYMGQGVGFTFGWVPDGTSNEVETLEGTVTTPTGTMVPTAATWTTTRWRPAPTRSMPTTVLRTPRATPATPIPTPSTRSPIRAVRPR